MTFSKIAFVSGILAFVLTGSLAFRMTSVIDGLNNKIDDLEVRLLNLEDMDTVNRSHRIATVEAIMSFETRIEHLEDVSRLIR